jgi:ElaA protein
VATLEQVSSNDVRSALFEELTGRTAYLLWQLRESVFVVEQACPYQELDGRDLEPSTVHLWVQDGPAPVAYLRLLEEDAHVRVGRVVVARSHRGQGLARRLMLAALERVGPRVSRLDAQSYLAGWYAAYGYEPMGPEFLEDGIPHVPMRRDAQSVRSWA